MQNPYESPVDVRREGKSMTSAIVKAALLLGPLLMSIIFLAAVSDEGFLQVTPLVRTAVFAFHYLVFFAISFRTGYVWRVIDAFERKRED